jgi:tight adherence protein B
MNAATRLLLACMIVIFAIAGTAGGRRLRRAMARTRLRASSADRRQPKFGRLLRHSEKRAAKRRQQISAAAVAGVLDQVARHCASGESLAEAFAAAAKNSPIAELFRPAIGAIRTGEVVATALDRQPTDHPDMALAVHVLRLCATQGGNVSESLDRAAATLREREAVANERLAQSAQARLSARVLTVLPIAFGGWTLVTTRSVRQFFVTPIGATCLSLGLGLNVIGWLLMRRVSRGLT